MEEEEVVVSSTQDIFEKVIPHFTGNINDAPYKAISLNVSPSTTLCFDLGPCIQRGSSSQKTELRKQMMDNFNNTLSKVHPIELQVVHDDAGSGVILQVLSGVMRVFYLLETLDDGREVLFSAHVIGFNVVETTGERFIYRLSKNCLHESTCFVEVSQLEKLIAIARWIFVPILKYTYYQRINPSD